MLHTLRKLVREIHRRSVWQVLGVYLAMAWGILLLVRLLTEQAGLPAWTPTMAFVLLLIGLPTTLATAVVQGGLPGLRMVDAGDPNELEGLTPAQVLVVPEDHPLYGAGIFTWRNAILGGAMSGALLVTSVAAYLAMWALGIGPVGSLVAQGIFEEDDLILLAVFRNRTDDASLGETVTDALGIDLQKSSVVTLVPRQLVDDALIRMGRDSGTRLTPELARNIAAREGIRGVVEGEVSSLGGGYRLEARIVLADGRAVAQFQDTAFDREELSTTVRIISTRIRQRLGESLRAIRAGRTRDR